MKKLCSFLICVCLTFLLCSCERVDINKDMSVSLMFEHGDVCVDTQLSQQEAETVLSIIDKKVLYRDNPSCSFDEKISFRIDGEIYAPACDDCCIVKECNSGKYFNISRGDRDIIEDIFSAYGSYFPCV